LPNIAITLNSLAAIYADAGQLSQAEAALKEAMEIYGKLNLSAYLPQEADTVNNLASIYKATQRFPEARAAYQEALNLYRELAKFSPAVYQTNVDAVKNALAAIPSRAKND
jgi:tetratricopeptide (TPR) repeat protein